ncbi:hypothetical protein MD484_g5702, partial [Candolleomyces efflorescens]
MYLLASHSQRWKHFRLSTSADFPIYIQSPPALESFVFDPKGHWTMDQIEQLCSQLLTPTLRDLTFDGAHCPRLHHVPWEHLRSLSIHFLSESRPFFGDVLPLCTSLESLTILISDQFYGPYCTERVLTMTKLRSLVVGDIHELFSVIDSLDLPALEELDIKGGFDGFGCQTLTELFERSGITRLRSLSWYERKSEHPTYEGFKNAPVRPVYPDEDDDVNEDEEDHDDFYASDDEGADEDEHEGGADGGNRYVHEDVGVEEDDFYVNDDDDERGIQVVPTLQEAQKGSTDPSANVPMEELIPFLKHPALNYLEELKLYFPVSDTFLQTLNGPSQPRKRGRVRENRFSTYLGTPSPILGPLILPHLKNLVLADAGVEGCSAESIAELANTRMLDAQDHQRVCLPLERLEIHRPLQEDPDYDFEEDLEADLQDVAEELNGLEVTNLVEQDDGIGHRRGTSYTVIAPPSGIRECSITHL